MSKVILTNQIVIIIIITTVFDAMLVNRLNCNLISYFRFQFRLQLSQSATVVDVI